VAKRVLVLRFGWLPVPAPAIRNMAQALAANGVEVRYVTSESRGATIATQPLPGAENRVFPLWSRRIPKAPLVVWARQALVFVEFVVRAVAAGLARHADMVVAVDLDVLLPAWIVARLRGAPLVYYQLEMYTERPYIAAKGFWSFLEGHLIKRADLVLSCEPNRGRWLEERYGLRTPPLIVRNVPPYPLEVERTNRIPEMLRAKGLPAARTAFYQGWVKPSRCSETLVEAAKFLAPGVVLFLVGPIEDGHRAALMSRIDALGVQGRVVVHPMVPPEELSAFTRSADLALVLLKNDCLNSYYAAPSKLYEALAAGLPVVAADFPGLKEIVESKQTGRCANPEDPRAIAQAINSILTDDDLRNRMSRNARRAAKERYCYQVEGAPLLKVLLALVQATSPEDA